ncbi:glycosyltransferase family 2 protein [Bacillus kexueae]|uniref:glycosyltransferase family 2 protein n=1 Tax=Aeribacillus kexueae TaxID=2078952 RepID=UPI001FAF2D26|nr:glycosyltransferase family 2 protein [Bacillus kexueae]
MKFSVIIPTYNVEKYIVSCIQSVLDQTMNDLEIIVVDDCSSDKTLEIVMNLAKQDSRISFYKNDKNSGPSVSRNKGIELAKGEYIAFLDSDDWWDKNRLANMYKEAKRYNADMICDDQLLINDNDTDPWGTIFKNGNILIHKATPFNAEEFIIKDIGLKPIFKKEFIDTKKIKFNENLRYGEDYLFFLDCLTNGAKAILLPEAYYYYRAREGSLVTNQLKLYKQTFETTEDLLKDPSYSSVHDALLIRRKRIKEALKYYMIMQPIKDGEYLSGMIELIKSPQTIFIFLKRFPKIVNNRVLRKLKGNE